MTMMQQCDGVLQGHVMAAKRWNINIETNKTSEI